MEIQSLAGPSRDTLPSSIAPESRREVFRRPSNEGIYRRARLPNRDFMKTIIPENGVPAISRGTLMVCEG